jgi:homocysteine S-methyltransferase
MDNFFVHFVVLAVLFNCSEPEALTKALEKIQSDVELVNNLKDSKVLLGAYANRLTQVDPNWTLADSVAPQPFRKDLDEKQYWEDYVSVWVDQLGVQLIGGCCGITPEHIAYIKRELDRRKSNNSSP